MIATATQRANGWIDKVVRRGDILYFSGSIDEKLCNLIEAGALRGCSGEFYVKEQQECKLNQGTDNRFLGGMAILGSDIPAVDIARVSEKNLVKRLKRKFMPNDSYLNEGVFLSQDRVNIIFHSRLKKFLNLSTNIKTEGEFMDQHNREEDQSGVLEQHEDKYCAQIAERIGDKIGGALTSIIESLKDKLAIKNETSNDTSQGKEIALDKLAYLDKLTSRMETFNQNFSKLSSRESRRDVVADHTTSYKDLVANIKLHQIKNRIESFTEAENDFAQKYGDSIRIEEEIKENA